MKVREQDVFDGRAHALRRFQILLDIPLGIDDRRRHGALIDDDVGRMRETAEIELLDDHGFLSSTGFGVTQSFDSVFFEKYQSVVS